MLYYPKSDVQSVSARGIKSVDDDLCVPSTSGSMTTRAEKVVALDAFMAARKRIVRANAQGEWRSGHIQDEKILKWPLAVDGVIQPGASIAIIGNPRRRDRLFFRVEILYPAAICRLDYTDEPHTNSANAAADGLPQTVVGEHYHSWPINRRFFKDFDHPVRLQNAAPYQDATRSFDAILRWFCDDTNIEPLPPGHQLELPRLERLL